MNFLTFCEYNREIFEIKELQRRRNYPDGHWMLNRKPLTLQTIQKDRERINELESLRSFKLRRDKFHAHFDKDYFFDRKKLSEDAPLKWSDLEEVVDVMKDIINRYSAAYDGNLYQPTVTTTIVVNCSRFLKSGTTYTHSTSNSLIGCSSSTNASLAFNASFCASCRPF